MDGVHKINDNSSDTPPSKPYRMVSLSAHVAPTERHVTALREIHVMNSAEQCLFRESTYSRNDCGDPFTN
jgi:hypothetical protein